MPSRLARLAIVIAVAMASGRAFADEAAEAGELEELLEVLQEETAIATRTKMNRDFVPGMVTVLDGDQLEELGARTVWDALSLVPGVQSVRAAFSDPVVLVRGLNFIFNNGNVKVLVNSIEMSRESSSVNTMLLLLPIEQVERIELIRGPASALYGDFATMGVLNIVTRRTGRRAFASYLDAATYGAGAQAGFTQGGSEWAVNLAGVDSDDAYAPVVTRHGEEQLFAFASWRRGGWSIVGQFADRERVELDIPPDRPPGTPDAGSEERSWVLEARYARDLASALHAEIHASYLDNDFHFPFTDFAGDLTILGIDLDGTIGSRHRWLASLSAASSRVDEASGSLPPIFDATISSVERRSLSLTLQDQWDATPSLTLIAGARIDRFDDVGTHAAPRVAAVWRLGEHHILKSQVAEAYRAPTFFELYATGEQAPGLEVEDARSTELSYVAHYPRRVARVTIFHCTVDGVTVFPEPPERLTFKNGVDLSTRGFELEWEQELGEAWKIATNVSYADPDDPRVHRTVLASSRWLGNLTLQAAPWTHWSFALRWRHVGERGDGAPDGADGFDTVDLTAHARRLWRGLDARAGVQDVLDDDVTYVITPPRPYTPIVREYPGRTWWAQLSFSF